MEVTPMCIVLYLDLYLRIIFIASSARLVIIFFVFELSIISLTNIPIIFFVPCKARAKGIRGRAPNMKMEDPL